MVDTDVQKFRQEEERIGRHLYTITAIITIISMSFIVLQFLTHGAFSSSGISYFYIGILLTYSLHKELIRWIGEDRKRHHHGELFLYGWIFLSTSLYIVNFLTKGVFNGIAVQQAAVITIEVLLIFLTTRALKLFKMRITEE